MDEKAIKKLGRGELMEIIYQMKKNEEELQAKVAELEGKLGERNVRLEKVGSIAEASLAVSGIFEAAQTAADTYLESIRNVNKECNRILEEAKEKGAKIIALAEKEAADRISSSEAKCRSMVADAEQQTEQKWNEFNNKTQEVLRIHSELSALLK